MNRVYGSQQRRHTAFTSSLAAVLTLSGCTSVSNSNGVTRRGDAGDAGFGGATSGSGSGSSGTFSLKDPGDAGISDGAMEATALPMGPPPWNPPKPDDNCGTRCFFDPNLTAPVGVKPADLFAGAGSVTAPVIVYPLPASTHPINMLSLTMQWTRAPGPPAQSIAHIQVVGKNTWDFYAKCNPPRPFPNTQMLSECIFEMPPGSWGALAYENKGGAVQIVVTTTDGAGKISMPSAPLTVQFSDDAVQGALYFWSISQILDDAGVQESEIMRAPFGAQRATPFIRPNTAANPNGCGGCHSLSHDGSFIAFAGGGPTESAGGRLTVDPTAVAPVPNFSPPKSADAVMMTLNPDGSRVITAHGPGQLDLLDAKSGNKISAVDLSSLGGLAATQPEWSADGSQIVVTVAHASAISSGVDQGTSQTVYDSWSVTEGGIALIPYNNGAFGPANIVVPVTSSPINSFPSLSPDGKWIVFVSGEPGGPYMDNTQNPYNHLRLVNVATKQIFNLDNATQKDGPHAMPGGRATWPKFAPFTQAGGQLMFITFHTHLEYGFLTRDGLVPGPAGLTYSPVQLWLSAIDFRNMASGDPSAAPIYLTMQDPGQNNHLGFWAEKIGCLFDGDAGAGLCGDYATCTAQQCVPTMPPPK
jgi:WD40 repeat protein